MSQLGSAPALTVPRRAAAGRGLSRLLSKLRLRAAAENDSEQAGTGTRLAGGPGLTVTGASDHAPGRRPGTAQAQRNHSLRLAGAKAGRRSRRPAALSSPRAGGGMVRLLILCYAWLTCTDSFSYSFFNNIYSFQKSLGLSCRPHDRKSNSAINSFTIDPLIPHLASLSSLHRETVNRILTVTRLAAYETAAPENSSTYSVQRRISFKIVLNDPVGIGGYVSEHVKEINDFDVGLAHFQVQTPGLGLSIIPTQMNGTSRYPVSQIVSATVSNGRLSLGDGFSSDAFVYPIQNSRTLNCSLQEAPEMDLRLPTVVELLVTLQGSLRRDARHLARPASHVSGQPRPGDSMSPLRADALRAALRIHGLDLDELLLSPDYQASSARRTCSTFINPRPNRVPNRVEPLEQSAARCAQQVLLPPAGHRVRFGVTSSHAN